MSHLVGGNVVKYHIKISKSELTEILSYFLNGNFPLFFFFVKCFAKFHIAFSGI